MVRVGDEGVARLDELVEAGLFGSRSEAAAFLIGAGIQAQSDLFARIGRQAAEIKRLRGELRKTALDTLSGAAAQAAAAAPGKGRGPRQARAGAGRRGREEGGREEE
jgi:Arc/MetJ-type ribon-helix-helix transcriptional regulator